MGLLTHMSSTLLFTNFIHFSQFFGYSIEPHRFFSFHCISFIGENKHCFSMLQSLSFVHLPTKLTFISIKVVQKKNYSLSNRIFFYLNYHNYFSYIHVIPSIFIIYDIYFYRRDNSNFAKNNAFQFPNLSPSQLRI